MNSSDVTFTDWLVAGNESEGNFSLDLLRPTLASSNGVNRSGMAFVTEELTIDLTEDEFIFDKLYIRVIFLVLYSIVFFLCFFGNLAVVLVVTLHWSMKGSTKFCLGNLAFANLCVGIFCVYQNLSTYLMDSWIFGKFLCKMYHFITTMSHTASILILVVICVERYLAILHPFRARQLLTIVKLRIIIILVWLFSALLSSPRLYYMSIFTLPGPAGMEMICAPHKNLYDSYLADWIYFIVLFILPLFIISFLYTLVGIHLWQSPLTAFALHPKNSRRSHGQPTHSNFSTSTAHTVDESVSLGEYNNQRFAKLLSLSSFRCVGRKSTVGNWTSNEFVLTHRASFRITPSVGGEMKEMVELKEISVIKSELEPCPSCSSSSFIPESLLENQNLTPCTPLDAPDAIIPLPMPSLSPTTRHCPSPVKRTSSNSSRSSSGDSIIKFREQRSANFSSFGDKYWKKTSRSRSCRYSRRSQRTVSVRRRLKRTSSSLLHGGTEISQNQRRKMLRPRQAVIRMLIIIVSTFALCNLPFHLRKLCQNYLPSYDLGSQFSYLVTPLTFLFMYTNCAINPILFAFMSQGFRSSLKDLLKLRWKRNFQSEHDVGSQQP